MCILVLIGVYLVFKVTISYKKLQQDNGRSVERYAILWDVIKYYEILEIVVISTQRDNLSETQDTRKTRFYKGYRGCGKLSDVLDFKWYATHMQQVCNTNIRVTTSGETNKNALQMVFISFAKLF